MFLQESIKNFAEKEKQTLHFWQEHQIFELSLKNREKAPLFSTYDGPPFATGLPHYGHLLTGTIKDTVLRFKTMKGFYVPRRFGWDCHGLPVENEIEKAKELSGAVAIEKFGIKQFNEECRQIVLRYTAEWEKTVKRIGRWVDFSSTYKTMDLSYMETVWWVFKQLYEKGLIYEGFKVMPFSTKLGTPLSNFEANLNYKDVDDPSLTVAFAFKEGLSLLVWTTTPWTLPSNLAIAVHPDLEYAEVEKDNKRYILAKERVDHYFTEAKVVRTFLGKDLDNQPYTPLFSYFKGEKAHRILLDPFVETGEGTGLVHLAPAFGEVDFYVCAKAGIDVVCPIDQNGCFTSEVPDYEGLYVKEADKEIIRHLKKEGKVFHHGQVRHRYPFCWRTDLPLIYKAVHTWFVRVEALKERMLEINQSIDWMPSHIKEGRFGNWLNNARDWAISRNRYWGTPIPIWKSKEGDLRVIGSLKELEEKLKRPVHDLHRDVIDDFTFEEQGKVFTRIPEVLDCWFESGSMPFAQNHYPFENKEETLKAFPADFIVEGIDQTRGWFYTLTVLAAALFDQTAFKHVIVNGIVLAEDGNKMSKRLKNYPDPEKVIDKYGADALRLYFLSSGAVRAEDVKFFEKGVEQMLRQGLIPLWNSYQFFATYANIYEWKVSFTKPQTEMDLWIFSCLQRLIQEVDLAMNRYSLSDAITPLMLFIDQLTNWYIRRSRARFWSEVSSNDREEAFSTLYHVLLTVAKVAASFMPFLSEEIYQRLRTKEEPLSVHLTDFPEINSSLRDLSLEETMQGVHILVNLGHSLRKEHRIKVRQPLSNAKIICQNKQLLAHLSDYSSLIQDELNVKSLKFTSYEHDFVTIVIKPNFKILGKKIGKKMPLVQQVLETWDAETLTRALNKEAILVDLEGEKIVLEPEDLSIERKVKEGIVAASEEGLTVLLDTTLTPALKEEGLAREIVNKINTMRKELDLKVTDRIKIELEASDTVKSAFLKHYTYIAHETLITTYEFKANSGTEWDLNGESATLFIGL